VSSGWLVAVEGPSAAGKSRAVATAARSLGLPSIPEAFDRLKPRPSLGWTGDAQGLRLERRLFAEDVRRFQEGRRQADAGATVLADTGFLGPLTYTFGLVRVGLAAPSVLTRLLRLARTFRPGEVWGLPDAILYIQTPDSERRRRAALDPIGHPSDLQARHQSVAREEQRFYRRHVAPEFGPRFRSVVGYGGVEGVAARIEGALPRTRAPHRRPSLDRILDAMERETGVS
jgi:hypothetical protein